MFESGSTVHFDRANDTLRTSGARAWVGVQLMRLAEQGTRPFHHTGISRLHALIGKLFLPGSVTEIGLASGGSFAYPSGDYYWNRLLTRSWDYEEDIQNILKALSGTQYTFLDIGANFGFFSCLAASPSFGSQRVIAVEPARMAFSFLERNLARYGDKATVLKLAIDENSGNEVRLYGDRHAGFSLSSEWSGAAGSNSEVVLTTSIDELIEQIGIEDMSNPVLVKLEVEGIEMRALRGALKTIEQDSAFIIEEIEDTGISEATRHVVETLGLTVFYADDDRFVQLTSITDFEAYRKTQQTIQKRGTSLLAFRKPVWRERLAAIL